MPMLIGFQPSDMSGLRDLSEPILILGSEVG